MIEITKVPLGMIKRLKQKNIQLDASMLLFFLRKEKALLKALQIYILKAY